MATAFAAVAERAGSDPGAAPGGADAPPAGAGEPAVLPAAELLDAWRQEVAGVALELVERHPMDPARRGQVETLLVRLTVDPDVVIRQPSRAAQEAFAVAGDPTCELPALVAVVERDPVLARGLLRHAASALHAGFGAPASLDDAVRRLGAKGVQVAVLAGMAESLLARPGGVDDPAATRVWAHMVRTGPRARALARAFGVPPHEAFTLGLLHDVGTLVLLDLGARAGQALGHPLELPGAFAAEARRRLHGPLGGMALLRWGVEPRAARAVATHLRDPIPDGGDPRSELLYVAERLDLALARGEAIALETWWAEGGLTTPRERVEPLVERAAAVE